MKIGIIGKGNVGTALARGFHRAGHEIIFGHRDLKEPIEKAVTEGDVIVLAVPQSAVQDVVHHFGSAADGKAIIDVTNALTSTMDLSIGCTTSAAEELQKLLPNSYVVKAFNTVFAKNQTTGKIRNERLTAFIAGDDARAKNTVMKLAEDVGFDPVDCGPLKVARYLEPMAVMIINLSYESEMGTDIGFKLIK
jgi:8-hydroxy-5-deazaflavin:NADPH oxidoreductase